MKDVMLIVHFIGLAMGLGTSFAFLFIGKAASKMEPSEAKKFMINSFAIARMGHIGLALLFISGGYLMTPYWSVLGAMPFMIAKLALFVVLGALIGIISSKAKKAAQGDTEKHLAAIKPLGTITLLTGVAIVILAVLTFH